MRNILKKFSVFALGLVFLAPACTDLEETVYSEVTADNFFQNEAEFVSALGSAYTELYDIGGHANVWSVNEISSDELMVTTKGGDWYDGGVLIQLHDHTFSPDNGFFNNAWNTCYSGISTCNRLIFQFEGLKETTSSQETIDLADKFIAELRGIRALWYYWLVDAFGNVPLSIDFTDDSPPANNSNFQAGRTEVYNFIKSELDAIIPLLDATVGGTAYGRFNQATGYALRAKLQLNEHIFNGTSWSTATGNAVIADCDQVATFGYSLSGNYRDNFVVNNSGSGENILAIPYDKVFAGGFFWAPMTLHYASQNTFNFTFQPWNGYGVVEEFYNSYTDPNQNPGTQGPVWLGLADFSASDVVPSTSGTVDSRMSNFLVGPQFNSDGSPTVDPAFEGETAASPDPDGTRLNFTPRNNEIFPNGWRQGGARIGKYEYELGTTENISNDFVVFRYADILLTKAEALWRNGDAAGALTIVNQVRSRAGVDPLTDLNGPISFQFPNVGGDAVKGVPINHTESGYSVPTDVPGGEILNERGREMFAEMTRRQDLIRYGVWGTAWWEKPASGATQLVMPIPQVVLDASAAVNQNPGY